MTCLNVIWSYNHKLTSYDPLALYNIIHAKMHMCKQNEIGVCQNRYYDILSIQPVPVVLNLN